MRKNFLSAAAILLILFSLSSCQNKPPAEVKNNQTIVSEVRGPLLVQVNNWAMGLDDFNNRLQALKKLAQRQKANINVDKFDFKRKLLDQLVNSELLYQAAKERALDKESDIAQQVRDFEKNLLTQRLIEEITKDVVVTSAEIEKFYNSNKDFFKEPEERKIREIVVPTQVEAKDILIQLLQGADFTMLARSKSIAKSRSKGGDLGYLAVNTRKEFRKFWEVAFSLGKGEVSNIFKGPKGYYIIKVEDIKPGREKPLSRVREDIKQALLLKKKNDRLSEFIDNLKRKSKIVVNEDLLR